MQELPAPMGTGSRIHGVLQVGFTAALLLTILFIFSNSLKIAEVSSAISSPITQRINGWMERFGIGFRFSEALVRKLGHLLEYLLLGFWLMLCLRVYTRRILSFVAWPLFLGLLVAVIDESIQLVIPGRSGQVSDILLDFFGALLGLFSGLFLLLLVGVIFRWRLEKKKKTAPIIRE